MSRALNVTAVLTGVAVIGVAAWWAAHPRASAPPSTSSIVTVPSTRDKLVLDGELEEESWRSSGRTGAFVAPGSTEQARPYSDARMLRDAEHLHIALYAADQDEKKGDAFLLAFLDARDGSTLLLSIGVDKVVREKKVVNGVEQPWTSGVQFGVDADGTLDDPSDEDEEWIVEASIPLASLGATVATRELRASFARCDTPKGSAERCGSWGEGADGGIAGTLRLAGL